MMKFAFSLTIAALLTFPAEKAMADTFFVTNFGVNTISEYDENGIESLFTSSFVNGPNGIALDSGGNVYVSTNENTIEKFSPDGIDLGVFASTGLNLALGLAFDRSGNLYAANFGSNTVEKFAPNGSDLGVFANVIRPTGLAFDAAGNLCVANNSSSIMRFAPSGAQLFSFTSLNLNNAQGLAFDSLGNLYVANSGSNTIEIFSPTGVDLGQIVNSGTSSAAESITTDQTNSSNGREVYIALRSDGLAGDGTADNPFDGSTQPKLDAIFKSFFDANTTNVTYHLGPGTFQMKGAWDYDWALLTGWHIQGAGRDLTIVKQVVGNRGVTPGSNGALFSNGTSLNYDNQSVEDLTCDCAWFRSGPGGDNSRPHGNFQGINLYGANPIIRNVKVTGAGWADGECFAILTSGGVNDQHLPDNALYENVEVSNGATGIYSTHLTGMAMINLAAKADDPTPVYAKKGRIINCLFNLPAAGNAGGMPAGYNGGLVAGCTFTGYWHGLFHDTFVSKNITIAGNIITGEFPDSVGVLFNAGALDAASENISIAGNNISAASGVSFASAMKNSSIIGNRIGLAPGNQSGNSIFLDTSSVHDIRVQQNQIDPGISYLNRNTTGCNFAVNRSPAGATMIPDTPQAGSGYGAVAADTATTLSGPVGLAFDSSDNLYVVNSLNATISKFTPDGTATTFAATGFSPAFIAVQRSPTLVNISTRVNVMTGDNVLDGGFIVVGSGTKQVLIRGLGPSLASAGISGVLADPIIELHGGTENAILASNDNWKNNQQAEIAATGIPPTNDLESALIATLSEGAYTVIERGKSNTTGVGLIEIYDLGMGIGPELANISTRGFVGTGSNVMIAGIIAPSTTGGSGTILVRALGPSLGAAGVSDPLADPVLELHDSNGALIATNDNWKSDQQTQIEATGIPPTNDAEAAVVLTITPGSYTAIESGTNNGTGVGLIEVYNLH
jgi:hypothetical protein